MKRQDGTRTTTSSTPTVSTGGENTKNAAGKVAAKKRAPGLPAYDVQRELKPTSADIQKRAYELYLDRVQRGEPGSPETDWQRAERELARR